METLDDFLESDILKTGKNDQIQDELLHETRESFLEAMDDDFNTPSALSSLFDFILAVNRDINEFNISKKSLTAIKDFIVESGDILGFDLSFKKIQYLLAEDLIKILIEIRDIFAKKRIGNLQTKLEVIWGI